MTDLPYRFAPVTEATGAQLDADFDAVSALGIIPCTLSGTNAITFTPAADTPTQSAYANYKQYAGVVVNTTTGATTVRVGALPFLPLYVDGPSGPVAAAGGEVAAGNMVVVAYDSALNTGAGGFHLLSVVPVSEILDLISTSQGALLYRNASVWTALQHGTSLQILESGTTPAWTSISTLLDQTMSSVSGAVAQRGSSGWSGAAPGTSLQILSGAGFVSLSTAMDNVFSTSVGAILTRGASLWQVIQPGTSGQVLTSRGAGTIPAWV